MSGECVVHIVSSGSVPSGAFGLPDVPEGGSCPGWVYATGSIQV